MWVPKSGGGGSGAVAFSANGTLAVSTGLARFYPPFAVTIVAVRASLGTAPTGASLIVDVNKNGTTIFTTQANRPTVAASGFVSDEEVPDVTALTTSDYLTVDVDQVGSTVAGAYLTVVVEFTVD